MKVERAKFHYEAMLKALTTCQTEANPTFVQTSNAVDPWLVEVERAVPVEVALQLGDIAHSLQSSLDVAMCDIALARGVGISDMMFPFAANEERFAEVLSESNSKRPFKKLGADVVSIIVDSKPYGGSGGLLRGLHDLNNHDKHRMAVPYAIFISATPTYAKMARRFGGGIHVVGGLVGLDINKPIQGMSACDNAAE